MSSGYDSNAVSCMVRNLGVRDCFISRRSNSSIRWNEKYAQDDGTETAARLGYQVHYTDDRNISEDELYFLSTNCGRDLGVVLRDSIQRD